MTDGEWRRIIDCLDVRGRDRQLVLTLDDGQLSFVAPPGEVAVITLSAGDTLKQHITAAQQAAADLLLGRTPTTPAPAGGLRQASSFYVLDQDGRTQPLGVGLSGTRVTVSGPRLWQADTATTVLVARKLMSLTQDQGR